MLRLICNILRMLIHTGEEPHIMSTHTGKELYIHDIIVVSVIKNPVHKTYPLVNPLVKMNLFVHKNPLPQRYCNSMYKP